MTERQAKTKVIAIASAEVGYREGANNWNKFAAEIDPLLITWGDKQNQPWCGEFVLWVFVEAFGVDDALAMLCSGNPTSIPLCSAGAQYFKDAGRWYRSPEEADVVFFCNGSINHTGIVERVSGGRVYTIEGNSGDQVARRSYAIGDGYIAGYGRPRWDVVKNEPEDDVIIDDQPSKPVPDEPPVIEEPDPAPGVVVVPEDDVSGPDTEPPTLPEGWAYVPLPILRQGDVSEAVRALQTLLRGRGYRCGWTGADGKFGPRTLNSLDAFQDDRQLRRTGVADAETWRKLICD